MDWKYSLLFSIAFTRKTIRFVDSRKIVCRLKCNVNFHFYIVRSIRSATLKVFRKLLLEIKTIFVCILWFRRWILIETNNERNCYILLCMVARKVRRKQLCVCVCLSVCVMLVCACVCDSVSICVWHWEYVNVSATVCVCVCVCVKDRERDQWLFVWCSNFLSD